MIHSVWSRYSGIELTDDNITEKSELILDDIIKDAAYDGLATEIINELAGRKMQPGAPPMGL
jgi:hypothetical protein